MLGLFASGILLEFFSWNSFFGLNVVLAVLGLVGNAARGAAVARSAPGSGSTWPARLLSLAGVSALVFAIIEGADRGWADAATVAALVAAVVALTGFVLLGADGGASPCWTRGCSRLPAFSAGTSR